MASVPYSGTAKEPSYQISAQLVKKFLFYEKNKMCFAIIGYNLAKNSRFSIRVPYWMHLMAPKTIHFLPYPISIRRKKPKVLILSLNRVIAPINLLTKGQKAFFGDFSALEAPIEMRSSQLNW